MTYTKANRNYEGVRFQKIREEIDGYLGQLHDDISEAWYDDKDFIWEGYNFGVPDEEMFNDFHRFSDEGRLLAFHFINKQLENDTEETKIDEDDYRYDYERDDQGNVVDTTDRVDLAKKYVQKILDKYPNFDLAIRHSKYGEYSLREVRDRVSL
jgi:hypothetical protein